MILPLFVLALSTIVLIIAFQNTKQNDNYTKIFLVICYLMVLGICIKYGVLQNKQFLEGV